MRLARLVVFSFVAVAFVAVPFVGCAMGPRHPARCDVLIHGGTVVDGTGAAGRRADVMILGDRITFVGGVDRDGVVATRSIDATGRVVTPGFIDPHAHGDPRRTPAFPNFLAMGVTTIVLGQDGSSPPGARDFPNWVRTIEKGRFAPNIAALVGHGSVRRQSGVGLAREVSEEQRLAMARLVTEAMEAGAFGMSTGLEYEPGRFAGAEELVALARPVAEAGGLVMSHVRSEDDDAVDVAVTELLEQCRVAGCAAHVSHLKIVYANEAKRARALLAVLESARSGGQRVTADVYPYLASYTGIGIVFPHWARPPHDYATVVADRRAELADFLRTKVIRRNGPGATIFGSGRYRGKSLAAVAQAAGKPFEEILIELGPRGGSAAYFVMAPDVMRTLLAARHVMVSSDGSPTMRHPRGHGAFARVLREFVREGRLLTLEAAVHKMSGLTAATLGMERRGLLCEGFAADVLVFDPQRVVDRATFEKPFERAEGFDQVLVNGALVRDDGRGTEARPGRLLKRMR